MGNRIRLLTCVTALLSGYPWGTTVSADADGSLPPLPYQYVNPPPALAPENHAPSTGVALVPVVSGKAAQVLLFTRDGQAGLQAPSRYIRTGSSARFVRLRIAPVAPPEALPHHQVPDGNAYRYSAAGVPGSYPVRLAGLIKITMRWPHTPVAIYTRRNSTWRRLCTTDQGVFTSSTLTCSTRALGTFVSATTSAYGAVSYPATPWSWLSRYLPVIGAASLVLLAGGLAYRAGRPDPPNRSESAS